MSTIIPLTVDTTLKKKKIRVLLVFVSMSLKQHASLDELSLEKQ